MKQRKERDLEVLKKGDMSIEEMTEWSKDLFLGVGAEKIRIPEDVFEFGIAVMRKNYLAAKDNVIRSLILRKILHTREVVDAGVEIVESEGDVDWNPFFAGAVTFLHDVGRFPQAHFGDYSDIKTGFDHASVGADMILAIEFPEAESMGIDMKRVAEAVREHSRLSYNGGDIYSKFIRDADKLGLMDYFPYLIAEYPAPEGTVTPGALRDFLDGKMVLKADMINKIDVFLCWLSWQCDFNFESTKKLFELGGMKEYMLTELMKMDKTVFDLIKDSY